MKKIKKTVVLILAFIMVLGNFSFPLAENNTNMQEEMDKYYNMGTLIQYYNEGENCKPDTKFYVQETKAPNGYHINDKKFEVVAKANKENKCEINIEIIDSAIILPQNSGPKTGDETNIMFYLLLLNISLLSTLVIVKYKDIIKR